LWAVSVLAAHTFIESHDLDWAERLRRRRRRRPSSCRRLRPGRQGEYVAALGHATVAFEVAQAAVEAGLRRFAVAELEYVVPDLLHPSGPVRVFGAAA